MSKEKWLVGISLSITLLLLITAISAAIAYNNLPSIDKINSCFTTALYKVNLCPSSRQYTRYGDLPDHLVFALVVSEDASFFNHDGFDWHEIKASAKKNISAGRWARGGSTITQQLAKNLYLTNEKSLVRKFKEFFVAHQIEQKLKKREILEKYFNVVEFGPEIFGIRQAAGNYFDKNPEQLLPEESAYLISLLPSPVRYSEAFRKDKKLSSYNKRTIKTILIRLVARGKITEEEQNYGLARLEKGLWSLENETVWGHLFGDDEGENTHEDQKISEDQAASIEDIKNKYEEIPTEEISPSDTHKESDDDEINHQ